MPRDFRVFLADILDAVGNVAEFIGEMTREQFEADKKTVHAVVRNLEVIGEAVRSVPPEIRSRYPVIPWQRIAGLRDILIHRYFGIDLDIVWDVVRNKLPELKSQVEGVRQESGDSDAP